MRGGGVASAGPAVRVCGGATMQVARRRPWRLQNLPGTCHPYKSAVTRRNMNSLAYRTLKITHAYQRTTRPARQQLIWSTHNLNPPSEHAGVLTAQERALCALAQHLNEPWSPGHAASLHISLSFLQQHKQMQQQQQLEACCSPALFRPEWT